MILQALRMTGRDWRAGELRFLLVALIVAVSALTAVGFFIDRMRSGLERDAHQLLGADLLITSDQPLRPGWRDEAERRGLRLADTVTFPSMAQAGEGAQSVALLAAVKAVSEHYPLRGQLKLTDKAEQAFDAIGTPTSATPAPGTLWVDPNLLAGLQAKVGGTIKLGEKVFTVAQLIASEPDRGPSFANFAPRVMLSKHDLDATGLLARGSRASYRLQVAAQDVANGAGNGAGNGAVQAYQEWVEAGIEREHIKGVRIESLENGRPEIATTLARAGQFLSLVGLLSALLAAVAVAMAARRFMLRHLDACAMLRCLGMTQNEVTALYLIEFALVGLAGSALGVLAGFGFHYVLLELIGKMVSTELPPVSLLPALQGMATGMLLLLGFALPPIIQLRNVPHNRVIRREQGAPQPLALLTYGLGLCAFVALLLWQTGDWKLALLMALGFLASFGVFASAGWLGLAALRTLRGALRHQAWRFAVTSLQRRRSATVVQIVSLSLGLMALLLLTLVRGDLLAAWRSATPADAPNRFVINVLPEQKDAVEQRLLRAHAPEVLLYPMIRGRLTAVNGKLITAATYASEGARRLADREFNLSTMRQMPSTNTIVEGKWFDDRAGSSEASVEEGIATTLGLKIGDSMRFDIAGQSVEAKVTSLRRLDWGSMRANFFVIINPQAMQGTPQTFMSAFHLAPGSASVVNGLTRDFPNLTLIDVGGIIRQVQSMLDQVVTAVQFLFLFTLASGVLVLYAALMASTGERAREAALLRALGATRRQLSQAQWIEYTLVGALSGLLAASGAALLGWALATYQFKFGWDFEPRVWLFGVLVGVLCALAGGWFGLRDVLKLPPLQSLRDA
ncbi:MAG: FtsX-like permease family protein [Pseudomonadota bacterium]